MSNFSVVADSGSLCVGVGLESATATDVSVLAGCDSLCTDIGVDNAIVTNVLEEMKLSFDFTLFLCNKLRRLESTNEVEG